MPRCRDGVNAPVGERVSEPVAKRLSLLQVARVPDVTTAPVEVFHCGLDETSPDQRCRPV